MITLAHWEKRCYGEVSLGVSLLHEGAAAEGGLDQGGLPFSFFSLFLDSYAKGWEGRGLNHDADGREFACCLFVC